VFVILPLIHEIMVGLRTHYNPITQYIFFEKNIFSYSYKNAKSNDIYNL
jgi:hypothetical protein